MLSCLIIGNQECSQSKIYQNMPTLFIIYSTDFFNVTVKLRS